AQLILDLDSKKFAIRERAMQELDRRAEVVETALRKALQEKPSLEVRRRLIEIIQRLERQTYTGEQLRVFRAIEVLEHIGTPEAQEVLKELAKGASEARLTQEAKAALDRLAKRPVTAR